MTVTAARDYEDLHDLVDRLSPRQAARLRLLITADPDLAPAGQQAASGGQAPVPVSVTGIWDSGRGDLSERHEEIIRERLKRKHPA